MTSPTAAPWAAAYTHAVLDRFAIWSDVRIAASGRASASADDWAASGLSSATLGSTPPCTGWPSWTAPCWVLPPAYQKPWRPGLHSPPPSAPSYAPNYTANFNVGPGTAPVPPGGGSPEHRPPPPPAAPAAPQASPAPAQEGPRGRSGAIQRPPPG
jgi:hypothetical protein